MMKKEERKNEYENMKEMNVTKLAIRKNKNSPYLDMEMRRTQKNKTKPPLILSKLPSAFEIEKRKEENPSRFINLSKEIAQTKINLKPIKLKTSKKLKTALNKSSIDVIDVNRHMPTVYNSISKQNEKNMLNVDVNKDYKSVTMYYNMSNNDEVKIGRIIDKPKQLVKLSNSTKMPQIAGVTITSSKSKNKIRLKPIEIKDPSRKNHFINRDIDNNITSNKEKNIITHYNPCNKTIFPIANNSSQIKFDQSPDPRISEEKNFAKTSYVNFNNNNKIKTHEESNESHINLNLNNEEIIKIVEKYKLNNQEDINIRVDDMNLFLKNKNLSSNKLNSKYFAKNKSGTKLTEDLSIDEMIEFNLFNTLENVNINKNKKISSWGTITKTLHVPTLTFYYTRTIPLHNTAITKELIEKINLWQVKLNHSKGFTKIETSVLATSQANDFLHIFTENCTRGSLNDLHISIGSIRESILKQITFNILTCLEIYLINTGELYGCLSPENIFFTDESDFNIKLGLGLKHLFFKHKEHGVKEKFLYYELKIKNLLRLKWREQLDESENDMKKFHLHISKKLEIFDLGFLILNMCLISFDGFFEKFFGDYICTHGKNQNEKKNSCCCLYHCIEKREKGIFSKLKITNFVNSKTHSEEFINFLCECLSYNCDVDNLSNVNFTFKKIKEHKWFKRNYNLVRSELELELNDILKVSSVINSHSNSNSVTDKISILNDLCHKIAQTLPKCQKYFIINNINNQGKIFNDKQKIDKFILGLSKLFPDFPTEIIQEKIYQVYSYFFKQ